jgi:hypothetical protein
MMKSGFFFVIAVLLIQAGVPRVSQAIASLSVILILLSLALILFAAAMGKWLKNSNGRQR